MFATNYPVTDRAQLVTVQLDGGAHASGQGPTSATLVEQVFLTVTLRKLSGQRGSQISRLDARRQQHRRRSFGDCFDTDL